MVEPNDKEEIIIQRWEENIRMRLRLECWTVMRDGLSREDIRLLERQELWLRNVREDLRVECDVDRALELDACMNARWEERVQQHNRVAATVEKLKDDDEYRDRENLRQWIVGLIEERSLDEDLGYKLIVPQIQEIVSFRMQHLPWDYNDEDAVTIRNESNRLWEDALAAYVNVGGKGLELNH